MKINQAYLDSRMKELDYHLKNMRLDYGERSSAARFGAQIRLTFETIILNIMGVYEKPELHKKIIDELAKTQADTAKVQNERARTPYEELQLHVENFIKIDASVKIANREYKNARDKYNKLAEEKGAAEDLRDLAYERLYKPLPST